MVFVQYVRKVSAAPAPLPHPPMRCSLWRQMVYIETQTPPRYENGLVSTQGHSSHRIHFLKVSVETPHSHCPYEELMDTLLFKHCQSSQVCYHILKRYNRTTLNTLSVPHKFLPLICVKPLFFFRIPEDFLGRGMASPT